MFDAAYCYLKYGASPHDYMNFEFYKLKDIERNEFLTMKRTHRVESIYNDKNMLTILIINISLIWYFQILLNANGNMRQNYH